MSRQQIAVVSHDAGGAEILSSYVDQQGLNCLYVLEGPARHIFERKLGVIDTLGLEDAIEQATSILCSASWQSDLEFRATQLARLRNKHVVVFLDHWINYRGRVVRGGESLLPNEIWVGDSMAENLASKEFPELLIRRVENPYFKNVQAQLAKIHNTACSASRSLRVLYVGEIIVDFSDYLDDQSKVYGYTEQGAFSFFIENLEVLGAPVERIAIRPHPAETFDKYQWILEKYGDLVTQGGQKTLLEEISENDVVVGCESMAMVVGLLAGKRVISCVPPGGKPCVLPQPEIECMQNILDRLKVTRLNV